MNHSNTDDITHHEAEIELHLESGSKCGNMIGGIKSPIKSSLIADAGASVEVEQENEEEEVKEKVEVKEGEINGEALLLVAVSVSHHSLPVSLIGLELDHEGEGECECEDEAEGGDRDKHGGCRADEGSGDMGVEQVEGMIDMKIKMESLVGIGIGCHQEASLSLNVLAPPLVASIMHDIEKEKEKEKEVEMWTQLPPHAHYSDSLSDPVPSDYLSAPSMIKCEDQSTVGEDDNDDSKDISLHSSDNNDCIAFKASNANSNIRKNKSRNHENDSHNHNDNHNDNNDEPVIESKRLLKKEETSDFSSPYKSKQQVLMWKSWGKDIDWSKMKFQGNSEIYTKAQESLSKSSGKMMRNVGRES